MISSCKIENLSLAKVVFILVFFGLLFSLFPSKNHQHLIVKDYLGCNKFYISKAYLNFSLTSVGNESALLQAWYLGAAIAPERNPQKLLKESA